MATDTPTEALPDRVHHLDPASPLRYARSWDWRRPRRGEWFRTCSYCGSIHPEDLAPRLVAAGKCTGCDGTGFGGHYQNTISPAVRKMAESGDLDVATLSAEEQRRIGVPEHSYDPGGAYPSWADMKYGWPHKFYVEGLRPEPRYAAMLHYMGSSSGGGPCPTWGGPDAVWVHGSQMNRAQRRIMRAEGVDRHNDAWYCLAPRAALHAKFYTAHLADPGIPDEVKEKIYAAGGLRFHFTERGVRWHTSAFTCQEVHPGEPDL